GRVETPSTASPRGADARPRRPGARAATDEHRGAGGARSQNTPSWWRERRRCLPSSVAVIWSHQYAPKRACDNPPRLPTIGSTGCIRPTHSTVENDARGAKVVLG